MDNVEKELATSALEEVVNPLEARAEDRLAGGFVVKKRLGTGSTRAALLVQRSGQEGVLKIALDPSLNARVREEGQLLHALRQRWQSLPSCCSMVSVWLVKTRIMPPLEIPSRGQE